MAQRTIDAHNHWYPKEYLDYLCSRDKDPIMRHDGGTHYRAYVRDVCIAHIDRAGHYDLEARIKDLDAAGLDTQILSVTIPGPETVGGSEGVEWAKRCNDALAQAEKDYPHRFYWLATVPWHDVDAAVEELERCAKMGCKGYQFFSNFAGEPVWLEKFHPIYEVANKYELPCLIHPADPLAASVMDKVRIPYQLWGYTLDTSMAIVSLILQGVLDKFPNLKYVHGHLGGMVPYFVRRLQDSYKGYGDEWGISLSKSPDLIYKERVWPDTTSFYLPAMKCCLEWVGPEHMGIGTDYAHRVGDPEGAIKAVRDLQEQAGLSEEQVNMILGKNFEKLFKLPPMPGRD
ncbi:MAG: amidohydrolase family protein [Actinobacteria bacterium]|nr:amidohydrolase family protein [Actinomycetota bacterium]